METGASRSSSLKVYSCFETKICQIARKSGSKFGGMNMWMNAALFQLAASLYPNMTLVRTNVLTCWVTIIQPWLCLTRRRALHAALTFFSYSRANPGNSKALSRPLPDIHPRNCLKGNSLKFNQSSFFLMKDGKEILIDFETQYDFQMYKIEHQEHLK